MIFWDNQLDLADNYSFTIVPGELINMHIGSIIVDHLASNS